MCPCRLRHASDYGGKTVGCRQRTDVQKQSNGRGFGEIHAASEPDTVLILYCGKADK
jgi:hypothetical protein